MVRILDFRSPAGAMEWWRSMRCSILTAPLHPGQFGQNAWGGGLVGEGVPRNRLVFHPRRGVRE